MFRSKIAFLKVENLAQAFLYSLISYTLESPILATHSGGLLMILQRLNIRQGLKITQ